MLITIKTGDITKENIDVIVNAANSNLLSGSGVCGAIHRAAGVELDIECKSYGRCAPGDAVVTKGYKLPCKWVIHAVCPRWLGGNKNESGILASAYKRSLEEAIKIGAKTIAFPAISTGIYKYPVREASYIATSTVKNFLKENPEIEEVRFICFTDEITGIYNR